MALWRIIQNTVPNFANDDPASAELSLKDHDALVKYQLTVAQSRYLDANSLMITGVCDHIKTAEQTLKTLRKYGYVLAPPDEQPSGGGGRSRFSFSSRSGTAASASSRLPPGMTVNTHIIDNKLPSRLAHISVHAHRRLIHVLFFWEEECHRWRILDEQEAEIQAALAVSGTNPPPPDLKIALEQVQLKEQLLPSQRGQEAAAAAAGSAQVLPPTAETTGAVQHHEPLPPYGG